MTYSVENINVNKTWEIQVQSATISGTHSVDLSTGNVFKFGLSGDVVLNYTNPQTTAYILLNRCGTHSLTFGTASNWLANDNTPLTGDNIVAAVYDGQDMWVSGKKAESFSPADIDNMILWLDAADSSTITEVSGGVDSWNDKSGNSLTFSADSSIRRPTYNSTDKRVEFNGSSNGLTSIESSLFSGTTYTNFIVIENMLLSATTQIIFRYIAELNLLGDAGLGQYRITGPRDVFNHHHRLTSSSFNGLSLPSTGNVTLSKRLIEFGTNTTTGPYLEFDSFSDNLTGGTLYSLPSNTFLSLGANIRRDNTHENFADCRIHEVISYNRNLSTSEREQVETYLKNKWSL